MATLLHDVGKGYPDASGSRKDHSKTGAELCEVILPRLGFLPDEVAEARSLVLRHLDMYRVATRRDLDDPETIAEFSGSVRGREGLRELFLLTVADISTTSPTAMTAWKSRMLEELYFASESYLAGASGEARDERIEKVRREALGLWSGDKETFQQFLSSMPERYLLANAPAAMVAHALVVLERGTDPVHAAIVPSRHSDVAELCVVADDRPGLLARMAAAMTANKLEVLGAQVYSRTVAPGKAGEPRSEAMDLFWVRDRTEGAEGVARALTRLRRDLREVCTEAMDPGELLRKRIGSGSSWSERRSPPVATEVVVDNRASPRHTVVEVFSKDRPGLLYTVARAIHDAGLQIALSKINTEGNRVVDVFYVSELNGAKVESSERIRNIREQVFSALGDA
jgi:[protein-PII] uridylyltransferase